MTVEEQISTEAGAHTTAYDARRQGLYVFLPRCRAGVYEESEVQEPTPLVPRHLSFEELSMQQEGGHPHEVDYP